MRRICMSALLASALYGSACHVSAWADPLEINPGGYAASQRGDAGAPAAPSPADTRRGLFSNAGQQRSADAGQQNSGGFFDFLFRGGAPQPSAPRVYQRAPDYYQPQRGLFQPSPPAYQPAAAAQPGGYQPGLSGYQPAPQQGAMINDPAQGYAPSGEGDMAHQPVDPKFSRQVVAYDGNEGPGTIVIDTPQKFLFLVEQGGKAMRYGIGVGRPGFTWAGEKTITAKREWPDWRPPDDMLQRRPDLPRYMAGGPENPLGARAMYLGSTLYRIHGSNEPWTIGTNVSSGCIRMRNEDVIDLYERVKVGTKVVVI
jgi:lipoprotein-anchoring transpeptidase ErfK/SrfK